MSTQISPQAFISYNLYYVICLMEMKSELYGESCKCKEHIIFLRKLVFYNAFFFIYNLFFLFARCDNGTHTLSLSAQ